jgi:hypothetical protein
MQENLLPFFFFCRLKNSHEISGQQVMERKSEKIV